MSPAGGMRDEGRGLENPFGLLWDPDNGMAWGFFSWALECLSSPDSGPVSEHRGHLQRGSAMDLARYVVEAVEAEGRSYRDVARAHGVSKSWVAKVVGRYRGGGYEAIELRSRAAKTIPHRMPAEVEDEIVALRKALSEEGLDAGAPDDPLPPVTAARGRALGLDNLAGPAPSGVRHSSAPQAPPELLGAVRGPVAQRVLAFRRDPLALGRRHGGPDRELHRRVGRRSDTELIDLGPPQRCR